MAPVGLRWLTLALLAGGCSHGPPNFAPDCPKGPDPRCTSDGSGFVTCGPNGIDVQHMCGGNTRCDEGDCKDVVCAPGVSYCDRLVAHVCNATGTVDQVIDCEPSGQACVSDSMGARCVTQRCDPGHVFCASDGSAVLRCDPDGLGSEVQQSCDDPDRRGNTCVNTTCADRCTLIEAGTRTTLGCHFLGAPMGLNTPGGILVYNPQPDLPATVRVEGGLGKNSTAVAAGGYAVVPSGTQSDAGTIEKNCGLQVTSTVPVYAWQLADAGGIGDGSALLPEHTLGKLHYVPGLDGNQQPPAAPLIAIVAGSPGTQVTVTPTGATLAGGNVPAGTPGVPLNALLQRGDLLLLVGGGISLSGTRVAASAPIAVYTGMRGAGSGLEAPVLPWATLGKRYASPGAFAIVVAREDATHITSGQLGAIALDAGQSLSIPSPGELVGDRAFAAVAFVDNGLAALVPDEQRLGTATMPGGDPTKVTVVAGAANFTVDGAPQMGLPIFGGAWSYDITGPPGLVTVDGAPIALYSHTPMAARALTGPFALDFVNP